jgi:hypothetical protein
MDIQDVHPLRDAAKFDNIWPKLKWCRRYKCCTKEPNFKTGLKLAVLEEMSLEVPHDHEADEDPFLVLGYGVNSYFEILSSLFWMMSLISIVFFPVLIVYASNSVNGLATQAYYHINMWSLGNMGSSIVSCKQGRLGSEDLLFSCPMGIIDVTNPSLGIMNTGVKNKVFCTEKAIWKDFNNTEPETTCTSYIDRTKMYDRIVQGC